MISITTKYALSALEELAKLAPDQFMTIETLGSQSGVPTPYLAKIMKALVSKRLIESKKGLNGGIRLKQGKILTLYDVAVALDDPILSPACFMNKEECNEQNQCQYHGTWSQFKAQLFEFLRNTHIK